MQPSNAIYYHKEGNLLVEDVKILKRLALNDVVQRDQFYESTESCKTDSDIHEPKREKIEYSEEHDYVK